MSSLKVLLVDDEADMLRTCRRILSEVHVDGGAVDIETESDAREAARRLEQGHLDVVFLDVKMPGLTGLELLQVVKRHHAGTICVVITACPTLDSAIEAIRFGAFDYLVKPFTAEQLEIVFRRAAERCLLQEENTFLRRRLIQGSEVVAESPRMKAVLALSERAAQSDASMLITGETGTGKTLLAKLIHRSSPRRDRNYVPVDCGALSATLLESELFGHERGAFTGAAVARKGLIEFAGGGTLLLDDVTNLPLALQPKLLGFLQERTYRRVGGSALLQADVRVIAATNRNPEEEVRAGRLREDLYFRLDVVRLDAPPLRSRREDILPLAQVFLARHGRLSSGRLRELSPACQDALLEHSWPGNVRELEHAIERACLASQSDVIGPQDLPTEMLEGALRGTTPVGEFAIARDEHLARFEREFFARLLDRCHGNVTRAAQQAGLSRNTLYRYLQKHGLPAAPPA
jgi:DNA-binding NtrC family response regulator